MFLIVVAGKEEFLHRITKDAWTKTSALTIPAYTVADVSIRIRDSDTDASVPMASGVKTAS